MPSEKGDLPVIDAAKRSLVRAFWEERSQHHQIRQAEEPLIRMRASSFGSPGDEPKVTALGEVVQVI
jgi:hypothetical protein